MRVLYGKRIFLSDKTMIAQRQPLTPIPRRILTRLEQTNFKWWCPPSRFKISIGCVLVVRGTYVGCCSGHGAAGLKSTHLSILLENRPLPRAQPSVCARCSPCIIFLGGSCSKPPCHAAVSLPEWLRVWTSDPLHTSAHGLKPHS